MIRLDGALLDEPVFGEAEREWRDAFAKSHPFYSQRQDEGRTLLVTTFQGHYGIAGYIFTVEGSPPHGILLVQVPNQDRLDSATLVMPDGGAKRLGKPYPHSKGKAADLWRTTQKLVSKLWSMEYAWMRITEAMLPPAPTAETPESNAE